MTKRFIHLALFLLGNIFIIHAQETSVIIPQEGDKLDTLEIPIGQVPDIFSSNEPLRITLSFNIRKFVHGKSKPEDFDAIMTTHTSDHDSIVQHVKLRARGQFRRTFCYFPPILISSVNKTKEADKAFGQNSIKLVTHCKNTGSFEDYILKEYLAYKLYNQLSQYSFRVRLLAVEYIDSERPEKRYSRFGFIIEDPEEMAERNHTELVDSLVITKNALVSAENTRAAMFEYMIGNVDWALTIMHNVKVIRPTEVYTYRRIYVPYDFDYSGFVGTSYAVPSEELGITSVKERLYMGTCVPDEIYNQVMDEFEAKKDQLVKTIVDFNYLESGVKNEAIDYLNDFFNQMKNRYNFISIMKVHCRDFGPKRN
jgi:hypothetical protein